MKFIPVDDHEYVNADAIASASFWQSAKLAKNATGERIELEKHLVARVTLSNGKMYSVRGETAEKLKEFITS
jgi:hypothetical protein